MKDRLAIDLMIAAGLFTLGAAILRHSVSHVSRGPVLTTLPAPEPVSTLDASEQQL